VSKGDGAAHNESLTSPKHMMDSILNLMKHFLSLGMRPFFFLTALSAIFFPMYLITVLFNGYPFPGEILDVVRWHGHELMFGMVGALLTGFLLTASSNWTGRPPLSGAPLLALVLLWITTRLIFFFGQAHELVLMITGPLFLLCLLGLMLKSLKGHANFWVINPLLFFFTIAQVLYLGGALYYESQLHVLGLHLAQAVLFFFLFIFSGRLIPFFTNSRFKQPLITTQPLLENTIFISALLFFVSPTFPMAHGLLGLLLTMLLSWRVIRLWSLKSLQDPMLWCLHLAHLWLPLYFALKSFEAFTPEFALAQPAIHALFVGGIGLFSASIMTRASLGHTGRPIAASKLVILMIVCLTLGSLLRVFEPLVTQTLSITLMHSSMGVWTLGFIFFLIKFTPIYFRPRL
jgi:uncharacterized protein involved in response to NO